MTDSKATRYSIRQVVALTGISEFVLRAWENRYHAFAPLRTKTGRRLYSQEDVLKARLLFEFTERNYRIGDIANLSLLKLQQLSVKESPTPRSESQAEPGTPPLPLISKLMQYAQSHEWDALSTLLKQERKKSKNNSFIHEILLPLIREANQQVSLHNFSITQEHLLSSFIKENLFSMREDPKLSKKKIRLVIASPEGDFHEVSLLIAWVIASHVGVHTLYLGPNVPKRDLCEATLKFKGTHLLLASTVSKHSGAKEELLSTLEFLNDHLPQKIALFLGGRNTQGLTLGFKRDTTLFHDFLEFEKIMTQI